METIKRIVLSINDPVPDDCRYRIVIEQDDGIEDPREAWDHLFLYYAKDRHHTCSDRGAVDPRTLDKDTTVIFPVAAYIHSGIVFSLGDGRGFPDWQWDVSQVGCLYVTKEKYEEWLGAGTWRQARSDGKSFDEYLKACAEGEVEEMNLYCAGVYWVWRQEKRVQFDKHYLEGEEPDEEGEEWKLLESCGGYLCERLDDIEFPLEPGTYVFAGHGAEQFVGDEYRIEVKENTDEVHD